MLENISDLPSVQVFVSSLARHLSISLKAQGDLPAPTPATAIGLYGLPGQVVETTQRLRATLNEFTTLPPYVAFVWQHTTNPHHRGCHSVSLKGAGFEMRLHRTPTSKVDVVVKSPDTTAIVILLRVYVSPDGTIRGVAPSECHKAFAVVGGRPTSHYSELAGLLVEPEEAVPVLSVLEAAELWQEVSAARKDAALVASASQAIAERDSALAERDSALAERDSAVAVLKATLAERSSAIAELKTALQSVAYVLDKLGGIDP